MPGKRIPDPSLTRTNYTDAVANGAEILTDWDALVWARPIPLALVGNSWMQGSYDASSWSDSILDDHDYLRVSTDGGITWRLIDLTGGGQDHPPVSIGTPDGGLSIVSDTQVLTLNPSSALNPGSESAAHYIKVEALKFDYLDNVGGGVEIYKEYTDVGDDRTHDLKTLVAGTGVTLTPGTDTITIDATGAGGGEVNTASNIGTDGVGVWDQKVGADLQFRHVAVDAADTLGILTISLDATDNDIDFLIDHTVIPHDELDGVVPDEHIDHSTIEIATEERIQGGGDLTATRTLTLAFDELGTQTSLENSDVFAFYRNESAEDLHYSITWTALKDEIETEVGDPNYVPLTRGVYTNTGLTGGGLLSSDRTISLAFNDLPTVTFDVANDYIAIWDGSNANHAKILLSSLTSVSISQDDGIVCTPNPLTGTGTIGLANPLTITDSTSNDPGDASGFATGGHTHELSIAALISITDVDNSPVSGEYLKWDGAEWVTDDPSVGASTPGLPDKSIQFNDSNTFAGNAGLLYDYATDSIYFTDDNASLGSTLYFGADTTEQYIKAYSNQFLISNNDAVSDYIQLLGNKLILGELIAEPDYFIGIKDPNTSANVSTIYVVDDADAVLFNLRNSGALYIPQISSATEDNILYFDAATGLVTYGAAPDGGGGGIATLNADAVSGLSVNGGTTSSASTIDLDQNDSKLISGTPSISDYIGYWDISSGGQRKITFDRFPGWLLDVDGVGDYEFNPGDTLDIAGGAGIALSYSSGTLTIASDGTEGGCTQLIAELGSFSSGEANLDLDVYSGATITLTGGGNINISMDNLEEGDTGHIEVTHTGAETLTFSGDGATVKIANNSYEDQDTVALTPEPGGIDVVAFWFATGNLHLAVIYDMN